MSDESTAYVLVLITQSKAGFLNLGATDIWGPDNSLLWGTVLCIAGRLVVSLASTHAMSAAQLHLPQSWQLNISLDFAKHPLGEGGVGEINSNWETLIQMDSTMNIGAKAMQSRPTKKVEKAHDLIYFQVIVCTIFTESIKCSKTCSTYPEK